MRVDAVVIGAGLAGMTCALRLAEGGAKVAVVAAGAGSLHLGGATIDVLGYDPGVVTSPANALASFVGSHPGHPYARVPASLWTASLEWLRARCEPLQLTGSMDRNLMLATAAGAMKPSALAPQTLAAGDLTEGGRVALVSFSALKDFYPRLAAANLNHAEAEPTGRRNEARAIELFGTVEGEADPGPLRLARAFDRPEFRCEVAARLEGRIEPGERVGFPAVLGRERSAEVVAELAERLGAGVFEIPTLPPSVPGIRLHALLNRALKRTGGRVVLGARVVASAARDGRLLTVSTDTGSPHSSYEARDFVVATGGVAAGGVTLDSSWIFNESALDLPLAGVPPPGTERFDPDVFGSHPSARVGVAVDEEWRPLDAAGKVVYDNVRVCGATLAGAEPHKEKSGNGISLVTGYAVANAILHS